MNYTELPTDDLIESYFRIDSGLLDGDGTARARLGTLQGMMIELESRGVCPREMRAPEWYAEAVDFYRRTA